MPVPPLPPFVLHCLELLAPQGPARARRMFGAFGLYVDELFIAIVSGDALYLKTDDSTRVDFAAAGCAPFSYEAEGKTVTLGYWSVPAEALDSPALMAPWARLAMRSALAARSRPRPRTPAPRREAAKPARPRVRRLAGGP